MKIGIISDTHGSAERWSLAYAKYLKTVDLIIHAGDVLYHGPRNPMLADYNPCKLAELLNQCPVPIVLAKGNCDSEVDAMVLNLPVQSPYSYVMIDGFKIVVTHGHLVETVAQKLALAKQLKADLLVTGHTHIAEVSKQDNIILLNPGSPALSKRADQRSTLALVDAEKISIIDIDTAAVLTTLQR